MMLKSIRRFFGIGSSKSRTSSTVPRKSQITASDSKMDEHPRIKELKEIAKTFGYSPDRCPACKEVPNQLPKRKSKCKNCGEIIYPRTNPITNEKIFLLEEDLETHYEMQTYKKGSWEFYHNHKLWIMEGKKRVAIALGVDDWTKIPDNDAKWNNYAKEGLEASIRGDWNEYRNTAFSMLELRRSEKPNADHYDLKSKCIFFHYNTESDLFGRLTRSEQIAHASDSMCNHIWLLWNETDYDKLEKYYNTFFQTIKRAEWDGHFQFSAMECWDFFFDDVAKYGAKRSKEK